MSNERMINGGFVLENTNQEKHGFTGGKTMTSNIVRAKEKQNKEKKTRYL